ncbi:hypothetical protein MMC27_006755 [Xylographa pallens]|nr:hypothetical protein [Xylographa pallens]
MSPAPEPPNRSSSQTDNLTPHPHDDPETARLRAWAHAQEYVVPGEDGTINMAGGSMFDFGDSAVKRSIERARLAEAGSGVGAGKADGGAGGEKGAKERFLGVQEKGEGVGQAERMKKKRGSFSKFFHRGPTEEERRAEEEDVVR